MKVIIAGGRNATPARQLVETAIAESKLLPQIEEVVHGAARGIDTAAEQWAVANQIPVKAFAADWKQFGRSAGPIRNQKMAEYADALIAVWDGKSRGTKNMIETAESLGLTVFVHRYKTLPATKHDGDYRYSWINDKGLRSSVFLRVSGGLISTNTKADSPLKSFEGRPFLELQQLRIRPGWPYEDRCARVA